MFDINGDGDISVKELSTIMKLLGQNPTEDEIIQMMSEADKDSDFNIDFVEFCKLMHTKMEDQNRFDELERVFHLFTKGHGRNTIDYMDLRDVFVQLGQSISIDDCKLLIELRDTDHDRKLDFSEFVGFFMTQ